MLEGVRCIRRLAAAKYKAGFDELFQGMCQRALRRDPRRSIAARYPGKAAYLDEVSHAAKRLIDAGYVLPEDLQRILAQSARRWDLLASAPEAAAAQ